MYRYDGSKHDTVDVEIYQSWLEEYSAAERGTKRDTGTPTTAAAARAAPRLLGPVRFLSPSPSSSPSPHSPSLSLTLTHHTHTHARAHTYTLLVCFHFTPSVQGRTTLAVQSVQARNALEQAAVDQVRLLSVSLSHCFCFFNCALAGV